MENFLLKGEMELAKKLFLRDRVEYKKIPLRTKISNIFFLLGKHTYNSFYYSKTHVTYIPFTSYAPSTRTKIFFFKNNKSYPNRHTYGYQAKNVDVFYHYVIQMISKIFMYTITRLRKNLSTVARIIVIEVMIMEDLSL